MKLSKELLEFLNKTFEFIQYESEEYGYQEYCEDVLPLLVQDLRENVQEYGIFGAISYWQELLSAEGARFEIKGDSREMWLYVDMCSTLQKIKACDNYCLHCKWLYGKLFRDLGYEFEFEKTGDKSCQFIIKKA